MKRRRPKRKPMWTIPITLKGDVIVYANNKEEAVEEASNFMDTFLNEETVARLTDETLAFDAIQENWHGEPRRFSDDDYKGPHEPM